MEETVTLSHELAARIMVELTMWHDSLVANDCHGRANEVGRIGNQLGIAMGMEKIRSNADA